MIAEQVEPNQEHATSERSMRSTLHVSVRHLTWTPTYVRERSNVCSRTHRSTGKCLIDTHQSALVSRHQPERLCRGPKRWASLLGTKRPARKNVPQIAGKTGSGRGSTSRAISKLCRENNTMYRTKSRTRGKRNRINSQSGNLV
jgi:hypothetical protein